MPGGYAYGNTRLRAMRSRLLTEADYRDLLAKGSIEEVITRLGETPYGDDVDAALVRSEGVRCVYEALRANLIRTLRQARTFYDDEPRALVDVLLRRWDLHNLLTIVRGQSRAVSPEDMVAATVPVGQLDEVALRELARQPGLRAALDLIAIWQLPYVEVLRDVWARAGTTPDLDQLELAVQHFHFAALLEALSEGNGNRSLARAHLQTEVDVLNIATVLRLVRLPEVRSLLHRRYGAADVRPLLIEPGGHVTAQQLAGLAMDASGMEGIVSGLGNTHYASALQAGWRRYQNGEGVAVLERELERWQAEHAAALFRRDPLSIAIPIGYFSLKAAEIGNLRLVAQAVALQMPREQVRRDLVLV